MINNHGLTRMACSCAIFAFALAHCGCQSLKGPSGWATAWQSKPASTNPSDRETVTYLGFGQKKKTKQPDADELKSRMDVANKDSRQTAFDKFLRQGNQGLRDNRLDEAKRDYQRALELRPDHPDCHHRLAVIADKQGNFGMADNHYEAALKQRPRDPNLLSDIGYSYSLRGDDRRAESTLKEALAVSSSHTGAMFNLGSIYAKQGRYEETLAMFRRGVPETQAQQNVAKLFPQRPAGSANPDFAVAQNSNSNTQPPNQQLDLRGVDPEQLKAEMNRKRWESIERRRQQQTAELPPRRDWMNDDPQQHSQQQFSSQGDPGRSGQPIVIGPGANQNSNLPNLTLPNLGRSPSHELPTVTPSGGLGMNSSGPVNNGAGYTNHGTGQQNVFGQGVPNGSSNNGFARDQSGTRPNLDVWDGAPIRDQRFQPTGGPLQDNLAGNGYSNPQRNAPPATMYYGPATNRQIPGVSGLQPSLRQGAPEQSDNLAAAQLGMNVGGLFPVVPTDANAAAYGGQSPNGGQGQPTMDTRFGAEFPSPPQYQNPATPPNRSAFGPGDSQQGSPQNSWGNSFAQPSRTPSRFADFGEGAQLAPTNQISPPSLTSDWQQNRVSQANSTFSSQPSNLRFGNDAVERLPSDPHAGWAEKPNLNGAAPFNGTWPPGNPSTNNMSNRNGAESNSIPMWNGGRNDTQPRAAAPIGQNQPSDYPEQWQFSRPR